MILSINQPAYLPWLGYFDRILKSDIHIVLDHVQFEKNSMSNRNKVRTPQGWSWLTVPIRSKGRFGNLSIRELEIADKQNWSRKHWKTLFCNYSQSPYFVEHADFYEGLYRRHWKYFAPLVSEITNYMLQSFGITVQLLKSSDLRPHEKKSDLILELCHLVGADIYLSGPFGRDYLNQSTFVESGIEIRFHDYQHPQYRQNYPGFESYMSAIDLLFNYGPHSRDILENPQTPLMSE